MTGPRKLIYTVLAVICGVVLFGVVFFHLKYRLYDRPRQDWYAHEIETKKIEDPHFPNGLVTWPMGSGNAAENYMRAAELLRENEELESALGEIYHAEDVSNDFHIDQAILAELVKATDKKRCAFVPKYLYIPDDPADSWPVPLLGFTNLGEVLLVSGDLALKRGDSGSAEEAYGRAIIMGRHLIEERFSVMQVMRGVIVETGGCLRLLDLYERMGSRGKWKDVQDYMQKSLEFQDQIREKSLAISGKFKGGGGVRLWRADRVEIVVTVLNEDEDPMFRVKAALQLGRIKIFPRYWWFESKRARKALLAASVDVGSPMQDAVEYALKYNAEDWNREKRLMLEGLKNMVNDLKSEEEFDWALDVLVKEEKDPYVRRLYKHLGIIGSDEDEL